MSGLLLVAGTLTRRAGRFVTMTVIALAVAGPSHAVAQGIGYAATPSIGYVKWNDALGLDDDYLYGGKLAFLLGPRVSLEPYYFLRNNIAADPADAVDADQFAGFAPRDVNVRNFGVDVQISLGDYGIVPFVRAGGGLLRLEPDGLPRTDRIALKAGGGIRLGGSGNVRAEFFAEDLAFRLDRGALYVADDGSAPDDPDADELRHNLTIGGGISIALGGGVGDPDWNPGGTGLAVEPFVGRLNYDGDLDLEHQNLAGLRAGIDFNSYFGLRGFYWRAVNADFDGTEDLAAYGGEALFSLGAGTGLSPYLLAGAGRLDFESGFPAGAPQEDRTALILGGGIALGLSDNFQVNLAVRDYLFDRDQTLEDVSDPDDLANNFLYSVGIAFRLGGRSDPGVVARAQPDARSAEEIERLRTENERLRLLGDREGAAARDVPVQEMTSTDIRAEVRAAIREELRTDSTDEQIVLRDRLQREDELEALMRRLDERIDIAVRRRIDAERPANERDVIVVPGEQPGAAAVTADELSRRLDEIERRLGDRLDRMVELRVQQELAREARLPGVVVGDSTPEVREVPAPRRWNVQEYRPYGGVNVDDPSQLLFGFRADMGAITTGSAFQLVPEVAFGVGEGGTTVLVAGNVQYEVGTLGTRYAITPYVEAGAGVFSESILAINVGYGAAFDFTPGSADLRGFVEHQGINFFDRNRLLIGLRLER